MSNPVARIDLGVNVDHVATIRQARRTNEPDPVIAAAAAQIGGADGITFHLREDRRHIGDRDVELLKATVTVRTNFELACNEEVLAICCQTRPDWALLVPESREEVTTEGGLHVAGDDGRIAEAVQRIKAAGILCSLFMDPDRAQVDAALKLPIDAIELHTGPYALARGEAVQTELDRLGQAADVIAAAGRRVHGGHGLTYANVLPVASLPHICELNIGHSIVSRSVMIGMTAAVRQMRDLLDHAELKKRSD